MYIKNYALLVQPLQQLVNESKSGPIQLDQCHLDVIENIRDKLCNAPIFPYPNPDYTFVLLWLIGGDKVSSYKKFTI